MGRLVHTGESVCLEPPGPQEQAPRGGKGGTWFPAGVGGAVQPSQAFQSAQCRGWAPGGHWLPARYTTGSPAFPTPGG